MGFDWNNVFDIERQTSKEWSGFLYEYGMLKLQDKATFSNGDPKNAYGYIDFIRPGPQS
jgi:hypothetical protein